MHPLHLLGERNEPGEFSAMRLMIPVMQEDHRPRQPLRLRGARVAAQRKRQARSRECGQRQQTPAAVFRGKRADRAH